MRGSGAVHQGTATDRKGRETATLAGNHGAGDHDGVARERSAGQIEWLREQIEIANKEEVWPVPGSETDCAIRIVRDEPAFQPGVVERPRYRPRFGCWVPRIRYRYRRPSGRNTG